MQDNKLDFTTYDDIAVRDLFAVNKDGDEFPLMMLTTNNHTFKSEEHDIPDYGTYKLVAHTEKGTITFRVDDKTLMEFGDSSSAFGWKKSKDDIFFIQSERPAMSKRTRDIVVQSVHVNNEMVVVKVPKKVVLSHPKILIRNQVSGSNLHEIESKFKNSTISFNLTSLTTNFGDKFFIFLESEGVKYRFYNHRPDSTSQLVFRQSAREASSLYFTVNKRMGIRTGAKKLDVSLYETFLTPKLFVNEQDLTVHIQLTEELTRQVRDVVYFDNQGFLEPFKSFSQFHIKDNVLILAFKEMPVVGEILILIKTDNRFVLILDEYEDNLFGQWKTTKGTENALIVTPQSNGMIRPERRQILIKNFFVNEEGITLNIPDMNIDDVVLTNESETKIFPIDFLLKSGKLSISINAFSSIEGWQYKLFVLSGGVRFRLFHPSSVLKSEFNRYFDVCEGKYFYFSKFGYLKFTHLNANQIERLYGLRDFIVNEIGVIDEDLRINFEEEINLFDQDQIVAKRYNEIILFNHELNGNYVILHQGEQIANLVKGFGYTLEIMHTMGEQVSYIPLRLKESVIDGERGSLSVHTRPIEITGGDTIESLSWRKLSVFARIENGVVHVKSLDDTVTIVQILAEYKERPVFTDVTSGIEMNILKAKYHKLRVVYRVDGKLFVTNIVLSDDLFV